MTYKIINIIPLIKIPPKAKDYFSYFSNKKIYPGNIVQIDFKKKKIYGYVYKINTLAEKRLIIKKEKINLKPVLKIINKKPLIFPYQINLAHWLKNYANISLASALSLFFPYKKLTLYQNSHKTEHGPTYNKVITKKFKIHHQEELTSNDLKNKKTLIIVPQDNYLSYLKEKFRIENAISSKTSEKNFFELIDKVIEPQKEIFLSTKNGIFLPWQYLDQIIIYDEGSIFYKEFFKPPYFDYRKIFLKFAELNKIEYLAIGRFPSLYLIKTLYHNKHNAEKVSPKIYFQKISTLQKFEEKIKEFKKTIIFVPQKSLAQKLICENCFYSLKCLNCDQFLIFSENNLFCPYCLKKLELPKTCPQCQKETNYFFSKFGAEGIYQYLLKIGRQSIFLKEEKKKLINYFKNNNCDLVGSLLLLNPELKADSLFFFNFDQFYFSSDIFLKEKFIRVLEFFSRQTKNIFIISEIINMEIEEKIKNGEIVEEILKERKMLKLPPYKKLVILKSGLTNLQKLQQRMEKIKNEIKNRNHQIEIIGPIFSKPFKQKNRFFLELILKIDEDLNFNLKKNLENIEVEEIDIDGYKI